MADQIVPGLVVGREDEAAAYRAAGSAIVCVFDQEPRHAPDSWAPVLTRVLRDGQDVAEAPAERLDRAADEVARHRAAGRDVFLHCSAGKERSPLVAAWYLVKHGGLPDLDAAYGIVTATRTVALRRDFWVAPGTVPGR